MSRWGEEEKKSKGIFGCLFAFLIFGVTLFTFIHNYYGLEGRRQLEKAMQNIVRSGYAKSEQEMKAEIYDAAEEIGVTLADDAVFLTKGKDDYNNPLVDVRIDYEFTIDLFIYQHPISIPIAEEVVIVHF